MELKLLKKVSRAATLELLNTSCYYAQSEYKIYVNGELYGTDNRNVFTLYSLLPDIYYTVKIIFQDSSSVSTDFITTKEAASLNIMDFGAVGDGEFDCTNAIQATVNCCPQGGAVIVPKGVFYTYPIFAKSDITIYVEKDGELKGGVDRQHYPILPGQVETTSGTVVLGSWEGNPLSSFASLVTAINCKNFSLVGPGTINGNAENSDWWAHTKIKKVAWRPRTIFLNHCDNVLLMGFQVENSPSWTIHPYYCDTVNILDLYIKNPANSPNTDGCNPDSCSNVNIIGNYFSVGDDCIAFKSGKIYMSVADFKRSKNLNVRNCYFNRGHGAVVIGSEIACGLTDLKISQCVMHKTDRGLRVKTRRGRGNRSVVDNIHFENIIMENIGTPFAVNMFYFCDPDGHSHYVQHKEALPVDDKTPTIGTISCKNITCTNCRHAGIYLYGLPENPIGALALENVTFQFQPDADKGEPAMLDDIEAVSQKGLIAHHVEQIVLNNVKFEGHVGEAITTTNANVIIK